MKRLRQLLGRLKRHRVWTALILFVIGAPALVISWSAYQRWSNKQLWLQALDEYHAAGYPITEEQYLKRYEGMNLEPLRQWKQFQQSVQDSTLASGGHFPSMDDEDMQAWLWGGEPRPQRLDTALQQAEELIEPILPVLAVEGWRSDFGALRYLHWQDWKELGPYWEFADSQSLLVMMFFMDYCSCQAAVSDRPEMWINYMRSYLNRLGGTSSLLDTMIYIAGLSYLDQAVVREVRRGRLSRSFISEWEADAYVAAEGMVGLLQTSNLYELIEGVRFYDENPSYGTVIVTGPGLSWSDLRTYLDTINQTHADATLILNYRLRLLAYWRSMNERGLIDHEQFQKGLSHSYIGQLEGSLNECWITVWEAEGASRAHRLAVRLWMAHRTGESFPEHVSDLPDHLVDPDPADPRSIRLSYQLDEDGRGFGLGVDPEQPLPACLDEQILERYPDRYQYRFREWQKLPARRGDPIRGRIK